MSELGILKINQHRLVFNNELLHKAFNECDDCLRALIMRRIKPIIVIHTSTEGADYRAIAAPTALIGQTKMVAHWVARLSAAGLVSAQLMIEPRCGNDKHAMIPALKTLHALTALGVIPIIIPNTLTWPNEKPGRLQPDMAGTLAALLNAPTIEPLLTRSWKNTPSNLSIQTPEPCAG